MSTKRIAEKSEVASGRGNLHYYEFDLVLTLDKFHNKMDAKLITAWRILGAGLLSSDIPTPLCLQ